MMSDHMLPEESGDMPVALPLLAAVEPDQDPIMLAQDALLVAKLRAGDEKAFSIVLDRYHSTMLRLAMVYVSNRAVAEEVVQEAWLGVLRGLNRFEGRSSFKTWLFRILMNCAKTRSQREKRSISFSSLEDNEHGPTVDPDRFRPAGEEYEGHWKTFPHSWSDDPEEWLLAQETKKHILNAIEALPPRQKEIITLRDIEGWTSQEIIHLLGITEVNQRVLLHRARAHVRRVLEMYFDEKKGA